MNDFSKTKIHFALALLGTLFVLHPFLEKYSDRGFDYVIVRPKILQPHQAADNIKVRLEVFHAYALVAALLAFSVYCYALALVTDRPHSFTEATGNYSYAIALMVPPLFAGLYFSSMLARQAGAHWAVSAPAVALGLGLAWFVLSQLIVFLFRKRMSEQDESSRVSQLEQQEIVSLNRARELFDQQHYDLSVVEAWKAIETRLRRVLLIRHIDARLDDPRAMIKAATRAGLIRQQAAALLQDLREKWNIAVGTEPLTREAADKALQAARDILSTIPIDKGRAERAI